MTPFDLAKTLVLAYAGLFLLADAALSVAAPERMWSYQLQSGALVVGLVTVGTYVLFGLHLAYEMRRWWPL